MTQDRMSDREAVLARYRRLREISKGHHSGALDHLSRQAILEHARRLGLARRKTLLADSMEELNLAFDLAIHSPVRGRSRAIDRYRRAARLAPGSDELMTLEAMRRARFSIWRVGRRHETAGLIVTDLLRETDAWLIDEGLEETAEEGMALALRLFQPEGFWMTCGVVIPVDSEIMEEVLFDALPPDPAGRTEGLADDPRFAFAVYRTALAYGVMENVALE